MTLAVAVLRKAEDKFLCIPLFIIIKKVRRQLADGLFIFRYLPD